MADVDPMDADVFWALVDRSREQVDRNKADDGDDFYQFQVVHLKRLLSELTPADIVAFYKRYHDLHCRAYTWDLWAVAYWLYGGCSDDSFADFRAGLISLGRDWFERIVSDPDRAAELASASDVPYLIGCDDFAPLSGLAYKNKTGRRLSDDAPPATPHPRTPAGDDFEFDDADEMRRRFPRLTAELPEPGTLS